MRILRGWPPSGEYRKVRRAVYDYIKTNPYCTTDEITKAMGWGEFFGGGICTHGVLQEMKDWNVLRKWCLFLKNPQSVKELDESEKRAKKIYTTEDFMKLDKEERGAAFSELKKEELIGVELNNAIHASGLTTLTETLQRESGEIEDEAIIVYGTKDGKKTDMKAYFCNLLKRSQWNAGEPRLRT